MSLIESEEKLFGDVEDLCDVKFLSTSENLVKISPSQCELTRVEKSQ